MTPCQGEFPHSVRSTSTVDCHMKLFSGDSGVPAKCNRGRKGKKTV